jgi:NAD(P)-dependent dehydrogenase (short-subunit alcohol dehydrogenase family)
MGRGPVLQVWHRGDGRVIVTSSIVGVRGNPVCLWLHHGQPCALDLCARSRRKWKRRNIRINTIHPGPIANDFRRQVETSLNVVPEGDAGAFFTQVIPRQRHRRPKEVVQSGLHITSDQSRFITRSPLKVDGGMSA